MEQGIGDFLARYGALIGCGLVAVCLYLLGTSIYLAIQGGLQSVAASVTNLSNDIDEMSSVVKEQLQELNELLNSMHTLFGGRLYRKDDFPKEVDGPTIQDLLQSIETNIADLADESSKKSALVVP